MPRATLSLRRIEALLASPPGRARVEELLYASKAQIDGGVGDELLVEGTADRLDLLTESGIGLYLQGALATSVGMPRVDRAAASSISIEVDPTVDPIRPEIAAVEVRPP